MVVSFVFTMQDFLQEKHEISKSFIIRILKRQAQGFLHKVVEYDMSSFGLEIELDKEQITHFAQELSLSIPLSLVCNFKELNVLEAFSQSDSLADDGLVIGYITPKEIACLQSDEAFCDLWRDFVGDVFEMQWITPNKVQSITHQSTLMQALKYLAKRLLHNESVEIETSYGLKSLILLDEQNPKTIPNSCWFMPFCLNSAQLFFKIEQEETQILATIEKPRIGLVHKGVFGEFFPNKEMECILPYDPLLLLLTKFLPNHHGIFLLDCKKIDTGISVQCPKEQPLLLSVAKKGMLIPHLSIPKNQEKFFEIALMQEVIAKKELKMTNTLYLGRHETHFLLFLNEHFKQSIEFCFEINPCKIIQSLETLNQTTQTLLQNFTKHNQELIAAFRRLPDRSVHSSNVLDLMGICGLFLDCPLGDDISQSIQEAKKQTIAHAKEFLGSKGPRIDFRLEKNEQGIYLDTLRTIRSVMSFKLAGVEKDLLCFGIVDSMAEFFANFSRDMEENYATKGLIICGEMMANKQFLDKLLHYLPKSPVYMTRALDFS